MRLKIAPTGELAFSGRFDPLRGALRIGDVPLIPAGGGGSAPVFDPANEPSIFSRIVADDLNALSDGAAINNTDDGSPGPGWPARVGANFASSPWSGGTRPILKKSILGAHSVVRFNGIASQNTMRAMQATSTTDLLVFVCGVKRGSSNDSAILTVHKDADSDDVDSVGEMEVYEGSGGTEFMTPFRAGQKSKGMHPGVGVPFVFTTKFDGTNNTSYLGDWPSLAVASTGAFASDWIGLATAHQNGGYSLNSQIDLAEFDLAASSDETLRKSMVAYLNTTYGTQNPEVLITLGDSITAGPTNWPAIMVASYSAGALYLENWAVGGHNLDQVAADATSADIYDRIAARTSPEKTIVLIWEFVNALNAGDTAQQVVDKKLALADAVKAANPLAKVIVVADFHGPTTSVNAQPASALLVAQSAGHVDAVVRLDQDPIKTELINSCNGFDGSGGTGGTHLNPAEYYIVAEMVKAQVNVLLGLPAPVPVFVRVTVDNTTPTVGDTITATAVATNATSYTYIWKAAGVTISGATGASYVATRADAMGHALTCVVTAHNSGGDSSPLASSATSAVTGAPVNTVAPVATSTGSGSASVTGTGTWIGYPAIYTFTFQWYLDNGTPVDGATSDSYSGAAIGQIYCAVTCANDAGQSVANTNRVDTGS